MKAGALSAEGDEATPLFISLPVSASKIKQPKMPRITRQHAHACTHTHTPTLEAALVPRLSALSGEGGDNRRRRGFRWRRRRKAGGAEGEVSSASLTPE